MLKHDAIHQPIIIGQTYGYTTNQEGYVIVTVGKAVNITSHGVTLERERSDVFSGERLLRTYDGPRKVNVSSVKLFPIEE